MVAPLPEVLEPNVTITYMPGVNNSKLGVSLEVRAHYAYILTSGWVRVTWLDGRTTLVSPAAVWEVSGKGVEYA